MFFSAASFSACPVAQWENLIEVLEFPPTNRHTSAVHQAFILGAGLGNRLQPLTSRLPKPLVPLFHRPLAAWAMDTCRAAGIRRFAINTHHLPEKWAGFGAGNDVTFFHESELLETGGGLKNIEPWLHDESLLIHNGDIFSTISLEKLIATHEGSGLPVTLALRSSGEAKHIALDPSGQHVIDIRNRLDMADGTHVFTGIYCIRPDFLKRFPAGEKISIIPAFLELAQKNQLGAITLDEGVWLDLGDRKSYLQAHYHLNLGPKIHPDAQVDRRAHIRNSVVGPGAVIGAEAIITDSVIWPGTQVAPASKLDGCIVYSNNPVAGCYQNEDL